MDVIGPAPTVTVAEAVKPLSSVVTVITAVPLLRAVTLPDWSTLATDESEEDQLTLRFTAVLGSTVAVSAAVSPGCKDKFSGDRETPATSAAIFLASYQAFGITGLGLI